MLRSEAATKEVFDFKNITHTFVPHCSVNVLAKFHENPSILDTLLIHLKRRHSVEIVLRVFAFKIFTSISRLLRELCQHRAHTVDIHSQRNGASRESDSFSVTFSLVSFCGHVFEW